MIFSRRRRQQQLTDGAPKRQQGEACEENAEVQISTSETREVRYSEDIEQAEDGQNKDGLSFVVGLFPSRLGAQPSGTAGEPGIPANHGYFAVSHGICAQRPLPRPV